METPVTRPIRQNFRKHRKLRVFPQGKLSSKAFAFLPNARLVLFLTGRKVYQGSAGAKNAKTPSPDKVSETLSIAQVFCRLTRLR